ncbi:hypothetical protein [Flavobacterium sharifuzzamanii]|uniref:hypothetical protein n=1 Tax=Flavobacterium sharifuzzamanii TaxID=2211133 RepID=UPI000DAB7DB3|nr:hypothetical protein [Flavobacterium sharifuzzamanii]KAF2080814.1 hypothetical protein DMA14_11635 [Flavobacterium sharifuzzamanii]
MKSIQAIAHLSSPFDSDEVPTSDSDVILNLVKGREWCLTIHCKLCDFNVLEKIREAKWDDHTSIQFGSCLEKPTWWSLEEEGIIILVGSDTEFWEICVTIPSDEIKNFLN